MTIDAYAIRQGADAGGDPETKIRAAKEIAVQNISGFLDAPPAQRMSLLQQMANVSEDTRFLDGERERTDVFDLILQMPADLTDMQIAARWQAAALEAAVVRYPRNLDMACDKIRKRLQHHGQGVPPLATLVKQARQIMDLWNSTARQAQERMTVKAVFPDAPVAEGVRVPSGFSISSTGIKQVGSDEQSIATRPILIIERCQSLDDDVAYLTLAWLVDGRWHTRVVPRAVIASRNKLIECAAFGLPVNSNNAPAVVAYFEAFEAENEKFLPVTIVTRQQGWLTVEGEELFLWGECVMRHESGNGQEEHDVEAPQAPAVRFIASDAGNQQIAQALRRRGEFSAWHSAIQTLQGFPRAQLALFTSLAAPLLKILGLASFIVDYSGETSRGKTSTLRVAASVWGHCWESGADSPSFVYSWDATAVFLERLPETLQSMPVVVDETKRAKSPEFIAKGIYGFCSGRGRGRGSLDGVRPSGTWATVMITSGEQPIHTFTKDGGTHARVIAVWGSPFGAADAATAQTVRSVIDVIRENYGHAGPRFVDWLLAHRGDWEHFRTRHRQLQEDLMAHAHNKPLAIRLCDPLAAICLAEELAHGAMDLPTGSMPGLCAELLQMISESDRPAEALRYVHGWASAHQHQFFNVAGRNQDAGHELVGRWDRPNGAWIGFFPPSLEKILREGDYKDMDGLIASWRDRGWLELEHEGGSVRTRVRRSVGRDSNARLIAILQSAIEQVDPPGPDAGEGPNQTGLDEDEEPEGSEGGQ
jgi:hypothetical protein